jgi:predicted metalloendopeptidase
MVAAHELTHAFDSAGRLYNQDGKLEEWWTNGTTEAFKARQTCIVDQYASESRSPSATVDQRVLTVRQSTT